MDPAGRKIPAGFFLIVGDLHFVVDGNPVAL
jgi:hypothetical protein